MSGEAQARIKVVCMEQEQQTAMGPPVASITFFKTETSHVNYQEFLKCRIRAIVKANPWLLCKLIRDKKQHPNYQLEYSAAPSDAEIDKIVHIHNDSTALELHWDMPYKDLFKAIAGSSADVSTGTAGVNKPLPRASFTIVPVTKGDSGFAFIFSMCHVLGDGHTYYQILNMVSKHVPITSVEASRLPNFSDVLKASYDEKSRKWALGKAVFFNIVKKLICGANTEVRAFRVDAEQVATKKAKVMGGGFVSTNDIVTSEFCNVSRPRMCWMSINFRNRLVGTNEGNTPHGTTREFAGNYEGVVHYDPDGYSTPQSIRKPLAEVDTAYCGLGGSFPGTCETLGCKLALVTNWASFAEDIVLDGCEEHLHLPYVNPGLTPVDLCIIFRPRANELGVLCFTRKVQHKAFLTDDSVFRETVASVKSGAVY